MHMKDTIGHDITGDESGAIRQTSVSLYIRERELALSLERATSSARRRELRRKLKRLAVQRTWLVFLVARLSSESIPQVFYRHIDSGFTTCTIATLYRGYVVFFTGCSRRDLRDKRDPARGDRLAFMRAIVNVPQFANPSIAEFDLAT